MPGRRNSPNDDAEPSPTPSLGDKLSKAFLKPAKPGEFARSDEQPLSVEELQDAVDFANDKERLIGLVVAPLAAAIGILVAGLLSSKATTDTPAYHELTVVLMAMSVLILVFAWRRKRLFLGIVIALYGLAIFNLHYFELGVPFILIGSWYLVRAYRLSRDLREAGGKPPRDRRGSAHQAVRRPGANKRYTPPVGRSKP